MFAQPEYGCRKLLNRSLLLSDCVFPLGAQKVDHGGHVEEADLLQLLVLGAKQGRFLEAVQIAEEP